MLKNYFKLAIKVLGRRKFFTFISLFGISFTLMILMLVTAFMETELGAHAPMTDKDDMIFVHRLSMFRINYDTLTTIDTNYIDNVAYYDTSFTTKRSGRNMSRSAIGFSFLDRFMRDIPFTKNYSFFSNGHSFDLFINSNKLTFETTYTDARFWEVYDFDFLEGSPYMSTQVTNQEQIAILSKKAAIEYFGDYKNTLGKEVILDGKHFKVAGIVNRAQNSIHYLNADIYIPYTNLPSRVLKDDNFLGSFEAVFLADNMADRDKVKIEILDKSSKIPMPNPEEYDVLDLAPATFMERYSMNLIYQEKPEDSAKYAFGMLAFLLTLFFLLPTLNLINLNVSRIMERSSEIGVRKAFGANAGNILLQFIFENVILTFIGGILGFFLALFLIQVINDSQFLGDTLLRFNYKVFIYSLLICLFFGILSGLIPAYRMSKIHIVSALKNNQL